METEDEEKLPFLDVMATKDAATQSSRQKSTENRPIPTGTYTLIPIIHLMSRRELSPLSSRGHNAFATAKQPVPRRHFTSKGPSSITMDTLQPSLIKH